MTLDSTHGFADPFSNWVFREPRAARAAGSVRGLNDAVLRRLLGAMDRLAEGAPPRAAHLAENAHLVVSPQPGYGKSHLAGRLFAELRGRATVVFVPPFQSPGLCWQSILRCVLQEMSFPDDPAALSAVGAAGHAGAAQLDDFATAVLAHALAGLVESRAVDHPDPAAAAAFLREEPSRVLGPGWGQWISEAFDALRPLMQAELERRGLRLHSSGWLAALAAYAGSPVGSARRSLAWAWLNGQMLEPEEGRALGLRAGEFPPVEEPDMVNEVCWGRLADLCQLAAFFRPFLFCFDQTEAYGHAPALARCFGMAVARLHLLAPSQLVVVTANQAPWEEMVARHMEHADKDRFTVLPLEGVNRAQACELARLRLAAFSPTAAMLRAFLDDEWLDTMFPTERNRLAPRQFLQACARRWERAAEWTPAGSQTTGVVPLAAPGTSPVPLPRPATPRRAADPAELLVRLARDLRHRPRATLFDAETFRWALEEIAPRLPGVRVEAFRSGRGHLSLAWREENAPAVFFGFEPGENPLRWSAIVRDVRAACADAGPGAKAVFFRTPELPPLPGPTWNAVAQELSEAAGECLDLLGLDPAQTARLYAARQLVVEASTGDGPCDRHTALRILPAELGWLWDCIRRPLSPEPTTAPTLEAAA